MGKLTNAQFAKAWKKILDEKNIEEQSALSVGMLVRNADGWIGKVVKIHPTKTRNELGHIGLVDVETIDASLNKFMPERFKVGEIITTPAGNFKPLSSGLIFSCGSWQAA